MRERYRSALMWALYSLLFLLVLVLQTVLFGQARLFHTKLSFVPVAIACIAMHNGAENGGIFALAAGTFFQLSGAEGSGLIILLLTVGALLAGYICDCFLNRNFFTSLLMSLLVLALTHLVLWVVRCYLGSAMWSDFGIQLRQILLSLLACPLLYPASRAIRKIGA